MERRPDVENTVILPSVGVAGLILASGLSRRFGTGNKLLATVNGEPLLRCTTEAYVQAGLHPLLVVVGHDCERVTAALRGLPIEIVHNPLYREGQSRALVRGVTALPSGPRAVVIGVGDQPLLTSSIITRLIVQNLETGKPIVAPRYAGNRGNPVLFARTLFPELAEVEGDQGGRAIMRRHRCQIAWVEIPTAQAGADVDTVDDLRRLEGKVEDG